MNFPSRTEEPAAHETRNQIPSDSAADVATEDPNGIVSLRTGEESIKEAEDARPDSRVDGVNDYRPNADPNHTSSFRCRKGTSTSNDTITSFPETSHAHANVVHGNTEPRAESSHSGGVSSGVVSSYRRFSNLFLRIWGILAKFCKFIGPGFMISVAYIDPGNYSTDVAAGAATKYKLLFVVLLSNVFAIVLQSLAVRLGTVTGLNLAQHCRAHLPRWLNIALYIVGEGAIVATDIAEVSL